MERFLEEYLNREEKEHELNVKRQLINAYLASETKNESFPYELTDEEEMDVTSHNHGDHHIPFKTEKWQLWWGEGFYRRDGNETPNSSDPEVAELQEMFAVVKRKHQANHRQWRKDFAGYLMQLEATNMEPPKFTEEYRQFFRRYDIPFVTEKYQNWWIFGHRYDDETLYCNEFNPFEEKFTKSAYKIHVAIYERRFEEARTSINHLSATVDMDRKSIASSIASGVLFSERT